jgi:hypothetical protein
MTSSDIVLRAILLSPLGPTRAFYAWEKKTKPSVGLYNAVYESLWRRGYRV